MLVQHIRLIHEIESYYVLRNHVVYFTSYHTIRLFGSIWFGCIIRSQAVEHAIQNKPKQPIGHLTRPMTCSQQTDIETVPLTINIFK